MHERAGELAGNVIAVVILLDQNVEFFTDILSQFLKFGMLTLGRTRRGRGEVRVTVRVGAIPPPP